MFVFNQVLGQVAYYGNLPGATDSLLLVPFEVSEVLDEDLLAVDTLDELTGLLTESTAGRVTASSASAADGVAILTNSGWLSPPSGPQITRVVVCYVPASGDPDTSILPLVSLDVDWTPDSISDFFLPLDTGYFQATGFTYV